MSIVNLSSGIKRSGLASLLTRECFSDYFPWLHFDPEQSIYINSDDTIGWIWECTPLHVASAASITTLEGLFRAGLPEGSILQVMLHADPRIEPLLEAYTATKTLDTPLVKNVTHALTRALQQRTTPQTAGIPVRRFRLFVAVKVPLTQRNSEELMAGAGSIEEILKGAGLAPRRIEPGDLLSWLRTLMNTDPPQDLTRFDPDQPIRKQVLYGTSVSCGMQDLTMNQRIFRCITPRSFPPSGSPLQTNRLVGGIDGMISDSDQIRTPFLYTVTVLIKNQKQRLHAKCNLVLQQQGVGSLAPSLYRKKDEYLWAVDELERGTRFYRVIPTLWLYGDDADQLSESLSRAKRIWEGQGYLMQEDRGILPILFIVALPFGLYDHGATVDTLDRDHILPVQAIATTLPVQADFVGMPRPELLFTGRKGNLCGIDLFDPAANNHNALVCASSGAGKSFLVNYLVYNYLASQAKIRIIDIGGSYRKMTALAGARYLDFRHDRPISLNPFSTVMDPAFDLPVIAPIIACMAAGGGPPPDSIEQALIRQAVRYAYQQAGVQADLDLVHQYLQQLKQLTGERDEICLKAASLAFTLAEYTSSGMYGCFFNGTSDLRIASDPFVVLELEQLKARQDLFRVVTLQVINAVTQDLYLSDRSQRRLIVFDEAWQFLGGQSHGTEVIEEGYRRARKYGGSFTIITQSVLDMQQFGSVGDVIRNNSAFKFYLESADYPKARQHNLLQVDDFGLAMLNSVKTMKPRYSEIFMETPFGTGVARLSVDPYSYYVFTSDPREIAEIDALLAAGARYEDAIHTMVERHHHGRS